MAKRLPQRPEQYFIDQVLIPNWDPSTAQGYDPTVAPGNDAFLPIATSIGNVGEVYPSLVVTYSNETSGGETTYDFVTTEGPGQQRDGQLLATARAKDMEGDQGYTGDSGSHSSMTAEAIVDELIAEVEDVCLENPQAAGTDFSYLGSQSGPDVPDDLEETPPVRIAQATIVYGWDRTP
jgi:hypothetical protein